jgi:hypothetical protein
MPELPQQEPGVKPEEPMRNRPWDDLPPKLVTVV